MGITARNGGFAGYHNYFTADEFFKLDKHQGSIRLRDGQRAAKVTEAFINGLHQGIEHEVGSNGSLLMYECGRHWGEQDMKRFSIRMRHEFGGGKTDIWSMNPKFVWESWWWPLTIEGFGAWRLNLSYKSKDLTVVEISNSAIAKSMRILGKPVCHLYAGLFAGVFSFYSKEQKGCIEIQCYSMGADVCKFLVGDSKQVDAAEFWCKEGASAQEIFEKMG